MPDLNAAQALALLGKLRQAAPPATADKLAAVAALIESLTQENAYLDALVSENPPLLAAAPPADADDDDALADDIAPLDLLAGVGAALRAPLAAMREQAELAQAELPAAGGAGEPAWWPAAVSSASARALRLLDAVEQLVALEQGRTPFDIVNFVATDVLKEAQSRCAALIAARGHRLALAVPQVVPLAQGDYYQTLVVLTDLLENAARYTPEGGAVRLAVDSLGTHVLFSVADSGIGLSADDLAHVGQPFWRGDKHPLVRFYAGTGLRLYLAKRTLARQAGALIFFGEPGRGSTFSFTLPAP